MKKIVKKLKTNAGFTLAETLMTVLILLMVAGVVAEGLPSAVTAYSKAVDAANAQVLLSTTVNALRGELSTARDVHFTGSDVIYISSATGSKTKIYKGKTDDNRDTIMIQDFLKYDESGPQYPDNNPNSNKPRSLVSKGAITNNLQVTYGDVKWAKWHDKEIETILDFQNITVKKDNSILASIDDLYIRCLNLEDDTSAESGD